MQGLFLALLNMSVTAGYVIAAVVLMRLLLKKAPKAISYALWAVAGFRLVFPVSFESVLSLIPFKSVPIPPDIAVQPVPHINSGIHFINTAVSQMLPAAAPEAQTNPLQQWLMVGAVVWLMGFAAMLVHFAVSMMLLRRRLRGAALMEGNICLAQNMKTPFILGVFKPKIYIPVGMTTEQNRYVVLHEKMHIRRFDHVVKLIAYLILCMHWFNPMAWVAFRLMGADMEMSCDERVLRKTGVDTKKAYALSLLSMAAERRIIGVSALAFGEGSMKERIKNVLSFRKTSRVIVAAAATLAILLCVGLALNKVTLETYSSLHIPDGWVGKLNGISMTLDDVRELAKKGTALVFEDLSEFKGINASSNFNSYIMVYGVEEGYRLIVYSNGNGRPDVANLESIWETGGSGIDIRTGDVDRFIIEHPSHPVTTAADQGPATISVEPWPLKYTPAMSSTPGIQLSIAYNGPVSATIVYEAQTGSFISWENFIVKDLGKNVTRSVGDKNLYWRPNLEIPEDDTITISVVSRAGEILAVSSISVIKDADGIFNAVIEKGRAGD